MSSITVGTAVAVVAVGGYYRWLRSPSHGETEPKESEVAPWQLDLPCIDTTLQMARMAMHHGQSAPLAVPQLAPCACSARAWRLWVEIGTPRVRLSHWAPSHRLGGSSELCL